VSDTAIFELKTNISNGTIIEQVSQIWYEQPYKGDKIYIFNFTPNQSDTIFCEF